MEREAAAGSPVTGRRWARRARLAWLIALAPFACGEPRDAAPPAPPAPASAAKRAPAADSVAAIVASEERILALRPRLGALDLALGNLRLGGYTLAQLFDGAVRHNDLAGSDPQTDPTLEGPLATRRHWEVDPEERVTPLMELDLWRPLLDDVAYFEHAAFDIVSGTHVSGGGFETELAFSGLARTVSGAWRSVSAHIAARWERRQVLRPKGPARVWRIVRFDLERLATVEGERRLFADMLDGALPDAALRARARDSLHERHLLDFVRDGSRWKRPHEYFRIKPTDWQPGMSVVDVDRDGFDDLYVMDRWGPNLLLRNRGDGSFEDVAADLGLDFEDHNCCAVFADFDNDGDTDAFLGRTLSRSVYLVNEGGRFVDRTADLVAVPLPALITSVSAVDYNGDGLLDVYFSTYAAELIEHQKSIANESGKAYTVPLPDFLSPKESRELARRSHLGHAYLNRAGPPNVLLVNRGGGRFEVAPEGEPLAVWRHTFQSTWSDFDGDGDADLYVANDFAPNNMFRNDGGNFVDITAESHTADIGFGMGASFGDYDNDGRDDLYVSNMYSKAGRRITARVPGLDPRLADMSRGNSLFRNAGDRFEKVSGLEEPALRVEKAGWSWGGQFVDVDNDGFLDLYASSGMYTAPGSVRIRGADL